MIVVESREGRLLAHGALMTDICEAVYMLTMIIPVGSATTYSSIARVLGVHPRIVARCLSLNRDPILVPCHRVVYSNGGLGGYTPGGVGVKRRLLEVEGVVFQGNRVKKECLIDIHSLLHGLDRLKH
ncbi:methylated-DNA/protein-cysteinemethyltransferase [Desulfurococcus mucosus DSM 2162]|uniref:Methylated-DNA/protein-cysteinemethyltransferase n=1 Tax=Desulfurococcus mucosus (strain ATCC 35584 / DSM 2162 / JCM 9187 / O7/1) TaxID=765177 RepID=E8RA24_DESM0|nr:methylated-DNA/protein-cysteinemethyltransferase [Desulfurococcus mucosus DSM 2162]